MFILNVYFYNDHIVIKDQNDLIILNYNIDIRTIEEIRFLTFINRGTMILRNSKNERIWPYDQEKLNKKLNKKLNLNFNKYEFYITDSQHLRLWTFSS